MKAPVSSEIQTGLKGSSVIYQRAGQKEGRMKIYTLVEDSKPKGSAFIAEHGLCLYFVYQGKRILFDTGASDAFVYNATLLGIDLLKVDICIISHAHDDHTGGLAYFLSINTDAPVYLKNAARGDFYIRRLTKMEYAGMDASLFDKYPDRFHFIDDDTEILDGLHLSSANHHRRPPLFTSLMYEKRDDVLLRDDLSQEQFLVIRGGSGSTVITGCSHSGILNILMTAEEKFGPVSALVGGFHLSGNRRMGMPTFQEPASEISSIIRYINAKKIKKVYSGHCTGEKALERLELMARVKKIQAGDIIEI
jgi:7,8-dihydropterin-6-yl-methyl-4-(beta-D-ribofuranosyl)aminobenzene 5'-phosphate synthase